MVGLSPFPGDKIWSATTPNGGRSVGSTAGAMLEPATFHNQGTPHKGCKRNIEMTPLCKIEVTHPRVLGSREVRRGGGVVDEQAGGWNERLEPARNSPSCSV